MKGSGPIGVAAVGEGVDPSSTGEDVGARLPPSVVGASVAVGAGLTVSVALEAIVGGDVGDGVGGGGAGGPSVSGSPRTVLVVVCLPSVLAQMMPTKPSITMQIPTPKKYRERLVRFTTSSVGSA
mmetsp:Transcript_6500/g.11321  ORF Transcript_6500/g.11321 Transcript_6500/m.11321 type:complete len:125 (+) Transcript_6500:772-1146(+)